jgi:NAD(P)-dependent dehydrogenase (short-subunit alcohol dehydrogenase family)
MKVLVTGAAHGLGAAICKELQRQSIISIGIDSDRITHPYCDESWMEDVTDEGMWRHLGKTGFHVDAIVNNAAINKLKWLQDLDYKEFMRVLEVNCGSIMLSAKYLLPTLSKNSGFICNIVSNAAHTPMTASLAYNASKGAAHIMTLQLARELTKRHGVSVYGVAPAKIEGTRMSDYIEEKVQTVRGWTPEFAREYQLNGLVAGEELKPENVARFVVDSFPHHRSLSGCILPYGI